MIPSQFSERDKEAQDIKITDIGYKEFFNICELDSSPVINTYDCDEYLMDRYSYTQDKLANLMRHIRNGIAHGRFEVISEDGIIESIEIKDQFKSGKPTFYSEFKEKAFRCFIIELVKAIINKEDGKYFIWKNDQKHDKSVDGSSTT